MGWQPSGYLQTHGCATADTEVDKGKDGKPVVFGVPVANAIA
jgi:hypothetical protein